MITYASGSHWLSDSKSFPSKIIVILFFAGLLFTGLNIYKDYGLFWDETNCHYLGELTYNYVFNNDKALLSFIDKDYGSIYEFLMVILSHIFKLEDTRDIFFLRHLCTFLLFYVGIFCFYRISNDHFDSWQAGILASLFLVLSPTIFGHSFYNSKDIPFLSMFIISMFTLLKFLKNMKITWAFLHALTCAILIDLRILGIIVPFFTFLFIGMTLLGKRNLNIRKVISSVIVYVSFLIAGVILFWPYLWEHPIRNFIEAFMNMKQFRWGSMVLFSGEFIPAPQLPWHYIPTWICITTPSIIVCFFFGGILAVMRDIFRNPMMIISPGMTQRRVFYLFWFFLPILAVIILGSVLYDGWRHMFFVYPAFVLLSVEGLVWFYEWIQKRFKGRPRFILNAFLMIGVGAGLVFPLQFMVKYHPYQNVFFNALSMGDMRSIKLRYELDYWGLSYRQALEYILKNDTDAQINVFAINSPGRNNAAILKPVERKRLVFVKDIRDAKYFLSNYRGHPGEYTDAKDFFSIKIKGAKIMVVYKIRLTG